MRRMRSRANSKLKMRQMRPERMLAGGFLLLIAIGTALLSLPAAAADGKSVGAFNALFTATSAVCVTGLTVVDTGRAFSDFGHGVLLILVQAGGLGFMVFATMTMVIMGRRITLRDRVLIRESMNTSTLSGVVRLTKAYGIMALLLEMAGALLLSVRFVPQFGMGKGLWYSFFHAVTAFCNAGFDLLGGGVSLTVYRNDAYVLLVISALIILGGTGFAVLFEVINKRFAWRKLTLHTRVVLIVSGALLLAGMAFFALLEWNNPATLAMEGCDTGDKLLNAFFQSVTMRTAGFNSISLSHMRDASKLFSVVLMFIGASPASTGGGLKTTTFSVVFLILLSVIRGQRDVNVLGRRLSSELMRRAIAMLMIAILVLMIGALLLTVIEQDDVTFVDLLFETASALSTAGITTAGTAMLRPASRVVLILLMYFGRVGVLTLALALAQKQNDAQNRIRYPEDSMMIG